MRASRPWIEKRKYEGEAWYYVRWRPTYPGEKAFFSAGTSHQTALDFRDKKRNELLRISQGLDTPKSKMTLAQAIEPYMTESIKTKGDDTPRKIKWALGKLSAYFGPDCPIAEIKKKTDPSDPQGKCMLNFKAHILQNHKVNGLINIIKFVNAFFAFHVESGAIVVHPGRGLLKKVKPVKVYRFIEEVDIRAVLKFCHMPILRDMFKISLHFGFRRGEVVHLRKSWIKGDFLTLPYEVTKSDEPRVLGIDDEVRPLLEKYMKSGQDLLFPGGRPGESWRPERLGQAFRRAVARARKAGAIKGRLRFHDSRHTFASTYLSNGGDIGTLQNLLGHKHISTTQIYKHLQHTHIKDEMKRVKYNLEEPPNFQVA